MNWNNLQKNDKIYILVPYFDKDCGINYEIQESYVINIKEAKQYGYEYINIRFKFTDYLGKRRRNELRIYSNHYEDDYIRIWKEYKPRQFDSDLEIIYVTYKDKNILIDLYNDLFSKKVKSLNKEKEEIENKINIYSKRKYVS